MATVNAGRNTFNAQQDLDGPGTKIKQYAPLTYKYEFTIGRYTDPLDGRDRLGFREPTAMPNEEGFGTGPAGDANKLFGLVGCFAREETASNATWGQAVVMMSDFTDKSVATDMVTEVEVTFLGFGSMTFTTNINAEPNSREKKLFARDDNLLFAAWLALNEGNQTEVTVKIVNTTEIL